MKWRYEIWCEAGFLRESEGYDTEDEAEEEAKAALSFYYDNPEREVEEDEYWYEIDYYEEEDENEY